MGVGSGGTETNRESVAMICGSNLPLNRLEKRVDKGNNSSVDEITTYDYDGSSAESVGPFWDVVMLSRKELRPRLGLWRKGPPLRALPSDRPQVAAPSRGEGRREGDGGRGSEDR
jgi:hypothetical protein